MGLATWRIAYMLKNELGPFSVFTKLRSLFGVEHDDAGFPVVWNNNSFIMCIYCSSIWVAMGLFLMPIWVSVILAASTIAIMVENHGTR